MPPSGSVSKLLIANRGEIAIRVARAASDLGVATVAVHSQDDAKSLHVHAADEAVALDGLGVPAYLNIDGLIQAANDSGCDAVHPGYGFLAESAEFARACRDAGITFVGPTPHLLDLFGDKVRARQAAREAGVPVIEGSDEAVNLSDAMEFFESLGDDSAIMLKAVAGGGGRGSRAVTDINELEAAWERCVSEAQMAFGSGALYVEQLIPRARHIEVQVIGDLHGGVGHLWERECSVQRRFQKIVEIAPAPHLGAGTRDAIVEAAVRIARDVGYSSLGTFEFLLDASEGSGDRFYFLEANARLQVEHTVTEQVTGVDLVQSQLRAAQGSTIADLGLDDPSWLRPRGYAIQTRVNMETLTADGSVRPASGTLKAYEAPSGPGVRTDGFGYVGYQTSTAFDSLLAKVIAHSPTPNFEDALTRSLRALSEFRIEGVASNIPFLTNVLEHEDLAEGRVHTRWVDEQMAELAATNGAQRIRYLSTEAPAIDTGFAGARVDSRDPLALFQHDQRVKQEQSLQVIEEEAPDLTGPDGSIGLPAPIQGTIVSIMVEEGQEVRKGQDLVAMEAMKMEHVIQADRDGIVKALACAIGDVIREGFPLVFILEAEVSVEAVGGGELIDPDFIRPDLQENYDRHAYTYDENRPVAVAKRRGRGYRMPRENIEQLVDEGSFQEYWPLIVARQHQRNTDEQLRENTPNDGLLAGTATINRDLFDDERDARAIVVHYDYTVLAGTQGGRNHYKQDRMFEMARRFNFPIVFYTEGGGGRPGDDRTGPGVAFDTYTFTQFSKLSGQVPLVGVTNGRCFAGNTALLACCDVIIATEGSTVAMGGPAMIEGGGLGIYTPEEVGPMSFQVPNGVVDILCKDEEEATEVAKQYLSYFQGPIKEWTAPDQRRLRHIVPENRLRLYDMKEIIHTIADEGSVLEIREKFGIGIITAFIRVEGHPIGVIANNPHHLAGAIDSDGSDKGARFLQLCDAFDIPVLSLMDCPGMMVGPDVEATALVRHCARMFNTGANLSVPLFGVVVRKAYGLGVQAMCGASALVGFFTVAWPTAEFAGMNIEGSVKLGYRKELIAIEDADERIETYEHMVERAYDNAKAVNAAAGGGLDDVIDPAETRTWIVNGLNRLPPTPTRTGKKRPYIDTW
ncbi:MAG: carbamoyl-phosphate synthase large subunit [Chloroflexi bacterium]|nr:carbamoyl-phosphate synthase large subunit [Chloroflexota bacterium]MCY3587361.1 carbamoyl-phosphate synthase large subunit [Chloroflexota bacterium]MCY3686721.1 carbamoyl-phosphate synthase large subunit [Chloroflexota bacterium]MDE2709488.1 carbamoyl-phosphate synthase large subunit [Chloroflexota bacterium]